MIDFSPYSENDFRLYHGWGTSPEQKKREKEYNAWYYQKNKEEILAKRRKRGAQTTVDSENNETGESRETTSSEYSRTKVDSLDTFAKRTEEEIERITRLIEANARSGDYSPEELANIKRHNEMIIENLQKLYDVSKSRIDNYSDADKVKLFEAINKQIDDAADVALQIGDKKTSDYLESIGVKAKRRVESASGDSSSGEKDSRRAEYDRVLASRRKGDAQVRDLLNKRRSDGSGHPLAREKNITGDGKSVTRRESVATKEAYDELVDTYKKASSDYKNNPNGAVYDYGQFLAELGENGVDVDKNSDSANRQLWSRFRKQFDVSTSDEEMAAQERELKRRSRR